MKATAWCAAAALVFAAVAAAADFGSKGGPGPANVDAIAGVLRQDPYDMELLISFGTSKGGSAGHLGLAIRDRAPGDDLVYSANFYADRAPEREGRFYTDDLMVRIPKQEYLFATTSSIGDKASFGLDFGEVYKRSVIGVRVDGVPAPEKEGVAAYFERINDDYRNRVQETEYHDGEKVAFKDLPDRFPSVLSRDFRKEQGEYEDVDNLFAMHVLHNMGRYSVRVNGTTKLLEIERTMNPKAYTEAAELATRSAESDSESFPRRLPFRPGER